MSFWKEEREGLFLTCKVTANASKRKAEIKDGVFKIWVTAQREKGKANEELLEFLADLLDIPKSRIKIVKGEFDSNKVLFISDLAFEEFKGKVEAWKR